MEQKKNFSETSITKVFCNVCDALLTLLIRVERVRDERSHRVPIKE